MSNSQDAKEFAQKEMVRMDTIFKGLKILKKERAQEFYDFSKNYFDDGKHFFSKEDYLRAFEAFIISWAYLDIGLKLGLFNTSDKSSFTIE